MDSPPLTEVEPVSAVVLHALLIKLIADQGGSVTVYVPELLDQLADATWVIAARPGPGPDEGTWTVERTDAPARG
jgi:hypothetical protein